jgi:hypothetical protein
MRLILEQIEVYDGDGGRHTATLHVEYDAGYPAPDVRNPDAPGFADPGQPPELEIQSGYLHDEHRMMTDAELSDENYVKQAIDEAQKMVTDLRVRRPIR